MTNKLSYIPGRTCLKVVLEKSAFSTLLIFYFISCEVGRRTLPSSIHLNSQPYHSDTRWFRLILYDPKNSWTSAIKRLATRKTWVHLKSTELLLIPIDQSIFSLT